MLPLRLAYLVEVGLLAIALAAVIIRLPKNQQRHPWRPRRPAVPAQIRRQFAVAGASTFVAWAVTGLFLSLIPSFVTTELKGSVAEAGAVVALMLGSSMVIQLTAHRLESLRAQTIGLAMMIAGLGALLAAGTTLSLGGLLAAAVLAGLGQGLAFMGSLGDIGEMAPPGRKADVVASYYVVVYVGTAVPVIGVGVLSTATGLVTAVQVFAYVVIAICAAGLVALLAEQSRRRPG